MADFAAQAATCEVPRWLATSDVEFADKYPVGARPRPVALNRVLVRCLWTQDRLTAIPTDESMSIKPLLLGLTRPLPPRIRFYLFRATQHESERQADTYRIQLTSGVEVAPGRYRFSRADGIRPVLMGFEPRLDVFIIWDADVNDAGGGFAYSQGVQAPSDVVYRGLATGVAEGDRRARRAGVDETIVVARRSDLVRGICRRIELSNEALVRHAH